MLHIISNCTCKTKCYILTCFGRAGIPKQLHIKYIVAESTFSFKQMFTFSHKHFNLFSSTGTPKNEKYKYSLHLYFIKDFIRI